VLPPVAVWITNISSDRSVAISANLRLRLMRKRFAELPKKRFGILTWSNKSEKLTWSVNLIDVHAAVAAVT
jgi:hypothetical protein